MNSANSKIKWGIRRSLLLAMNGIIIALLTIVTYVQISFQVKILEKELERRTVLMKSVLLERGKTLAATISRQAENDIAVFNFSNLFNNLNNLVAEDRELHYAILMDKSKIAHVHTLNPALRLEMLNEPADNYASKQVETATCEVDLDGESMLEIITPLYLSTNHWGYLRLGFSLKKLNHEIQASRLEISTQIQSMVIRSIAIAFVFVCASSLIVLVISTKLSSPIVHLTESARELAKGNFSASDDIEVHSRNEVGVLAETFVEMSRNLKDYSQNLESKVDDRTQELSTTLENLKKTQNQLIESEKMASLGGLVAGVAHEINTPIGIGITAASTLADNMAVFYESYKTDSIKRSELKKIIENSIRNSELVIKNLDRAAELVQSFKQVAVDQSTEEQRTFDIRAYLQEILLSLQPQLKLTSHQLDVNCDDSYTVSTYPGVLSQIITNLIQNSIVHGYPDHASGNIKISVKIVNAVLSLTYTDDGNGIEKDVLPQIFDPFFTTNSQHGGTGLGLHVIYNLVTQKLKGTIRCESEVGVHTTFYLQFTVKVMDEL